MIDRSKGSLGDETPDPHKRISGVWINGIDWSAEVDMLRQLLSGELEPVNMPQGFHQRWNQPRPKGDLGITDGDINPGGASRWDPSLLPETGVSVLAVMEGAEKHDFTVEYFGTNERIMNNDEESYEAESIQNLLQRREEDDKYFEFWLANCIMEFYERNQKLHQLLTQALGLSLDGIVAKFAIELSKRSSDEIRAELLLAVEELKAQESYLEKLWNNDPEIVVIGENDDPKPQMEMQSMIGKATVELLVL